MDLLQLQYFQKVAQTGHLSRTAKDLHISQPSLSQTIARLEKELGVKLFNRQGRQIQLNAYGKVFLKQVELALHALEEGRRQVTDMAGLDKGTISIDSTSIPYFPEAIQSFRVQYPDVHFKIKNVMTQEQKESLLEQGEIDLCLSCSPIQRNGIQNRSIASEEVVLAVPLTHPLAIQEKISLDQVQEEPFMCFKQGHSFRETTDQFCTQAGFQPNVILEVDEIHTMKQLMNAGIGITFWLTSLLEPENPFHPLRIEKPNCIRHYYLSWSDKHYLSKASQTFRDWLMEYLQDSSFDQTV